VYHLNRFTHGFCEKPDEFGVFGTVVNIDAL
jgi:hypothetical protein